MIHVTGRLIMCFAPVFHVWHEELNNVPNSKMYNLRKVINDVKFIPYETGLEKYNAIRDLFM